MIWFVLPKYILVTNKTNIRYLSGFSGTAGYLLLADRKGFLFTDARYHEVAKKVLPKGFSVIDTTSGFEKPFREFLKKYRVKTLGFDGGSVTLRFWKFLKKNTKGVHLMDIGEKISEERMVKNSEEIKNIERAQEITDEIFLRLKKWLRSGVTEQAVAWQIEALAHELRCDDISFPPIIGINEHSASPHHQNSDRRLKHGDLILIDMGVIYKGYCSDMTRVLFTKTPTPEQRRVYELVLEAQETAIKKLHAGVTGKMADSWARGVIEKAGFGKYFGHSLGHGVGLDIHELPNLSQKYSGKIPAGSVVTAEPGIYLPGKFGVRLEDMVLVTKAGCRNLTKSPKAIQETIITL